MKNLKPKSLPFIFALTIFLTSACISIPKPKEYFVKDNVTQKISLPEEINLEIYIYRDGYHSKTEIVNIGQEYGENNTHVREKIDKIKQKLQERNLFSKIYVSSGKEENLRKLHTLKIFYKWSGDYDSKHYYCQWATALSLGIIPFWQDTFCNVEISLYDSEKRLINNSILSAKISDYKQILLLPLLPFFRAKKAEDHVFNWAYNEIALSIVNWQK